MCVAYSYSFLHFMLSNLSPCHDDPHQLVQVGVSGGGGCVRGLKGGGVSQGVEGGVGVSRCV